ncbi:NUDIX hydrolase [Actinacidiphila guanduensis]|uniref:ADP-ribose pyrophosphatase YjhB, NUDIX family n=1 Tax=Actinacidiphila guanduensis TaxID=310781 RepID=A0A1H0QNQ3_9ACTN|nr:NUDIX domain-containing protein [Actinacidiphila guanduensis]SDP18715.1 ADP-ribose pyrophosphatase YjhB, NUDIX family [Actinacidiphila guanduensis]
MSASERARQVVRAVVLYDGRLLLVDRGHGWELPSGTPEPSEPAAATAARVVQELTGFLADGTEPLTPSGPGETDNPPAVVCQLLSESPSDGAALPPGKVRWSPIPEALDAGLPAAVNDYLRGHTPV